MLKEMIEYDRKMLITLNEKVKQNITQINRPDLIIDLLEVLIQSDDLYYTKIREMSEIHYDRSIQK